MQFTLLSLLCLAACAAAGSRCSPIVDLGYARYRGHRTGTVDEFLGMRFAKTPVGELRFRAPQDPDHVDGLQDAYNFRDICVGVGQSLGDGVGEDCLFVNVFRPSNATRRSKLPVWVFIQGGGYAANSDANFNGSTVVQESGQGVVFVNFNYRVGVLGFLAAEEVRRDGDLNAGLLDQRKLLHWVQKYIHKFGGDPNHVVIHGDSAGGGSVAYHMTAYEGRKENNLFVGAIPESPFWPTQREVSEMEFQYEGLLDKAACKSLGCLRSLSTETLLEAAAVRPFPGSSGNPLWYWLPVVDGTLVVDHFYNLFERGSFVRVPLMGGDDTDEGTAFASNAATAAEMSAFLKNNYPHLAPEELEAVNKLYPQLDPLPKHAAYFPSTAAAYGDSTFVCAGNSMTSAVARYLDPEQTWNYRYNVQDPDNIANGLGVPHVFEKTAIFGLDNAGLSPASYRSTNAAIIPIVMHYFISFVQTLNPNTHKHESAPTWDAWGSGDGRRLKLETGDTWMEMVPKELNLRCSLWKELNPNMQQ